MKKKYVLSILTILLLVSCGRKGSEQKLPNDSVQDLPKVVSGENKEERVTFIGHVSEVLNSGTTIIEVDEDGYFKKGSKIDIGSTGDAIYLTGTNVKISFSGDVLETDPAQIFPTSIELLNAQSGYKTLENIPEKYSKEEALNDGCVVVELNNCYNKNVLESFLNDSGNNVSSFVRTVLFTKEGDMIITDVNYIKRSKKYVVRRDITRDEYSNEEGRKITEYEFSNLIKEVKDNRNDIYLENPKSNITSENPTGKGEYELSEDSMYIASYWEELL